MTSPPTPMTPWEIVGDSQTGWSEVESAPYQVMILSNRLLASLIIDKGHQPGVISQKFMYNDAHGLPYL